MKKQITLLAMAVSTISFGQNLIPNADWELGPTVSTDYATGWSVNGPSLWTDSHLSPDRIVAGSVAAFRDNDPAQSGNAYVMFYGPYMEAGKCTLVTPLIAGHSYFMRYYLDVDNNFDGGPGAIRFRFNGGDSLLSLYVTNTGVWQGMTTSFIATYNSTELELVGVGQNLTKIDNMTLYDSTAVGVEELGIRNYELGIYPNPTSGELRIADFGLRIEGIKIFNVLGQTVYQSEITTSTSGRTGPKSEISVDISALAKGVYFIQINNTINKKLIKQ